MNVRVGNEDYEDMEDRITVEPGFEKVKIIVFKEASIQE